VAFCFLNLGCFPVAIAVGQVGSFFVNQHGAMLALVGREMGQHVRIPYFLGMLKVVSFGLFYI
jgi:hypothetical protein